MGNNEGTLVIAPVRPFGQNDEYPTALAEEVAGGLHTVADTAARDLIPAIRRRWGMFTYTLDTGTLYQLVDDGVHLIDDPLSWVAYTPGADMVPPNVLEVLPLPVAEVAGKIYNTCADALDAICHYRGTVFAQVSSPELYTVETYTHDELVGYYVTMQSGDSIDESIRIVSNSDQTITLESEFSSYPSAADKYVISSVPYGPTPNNLWTIKVHGYNDEDIVVQNYVFTVLDKSTILTGVITTEATDEYSSGIFGGTIQQFILDVAGTYLVIDGSIINKINDDKMPNTGSSYLVIRNSPLIMASFDGSFDISDLGALALVYITIDNSTISANLIQSLGGPS